MEAGEAEKFPRRLGVPRVDDGNKLLLTRAWAERWATRQRARAHAESGAEWRRYIAQHITAARTPAVIADRAGSIGAQPVAAQIASWIDALNREAGQILHNLLPPSGAARRQLTASALPDQKKSQRWRELCPASPVVSRENATRYSGAIPNRESALEVTRTSQARDLRKLM
jgi:hypothetical protein